MVFVTNRLDKRHFETVQDTLTTLYKDRVIAQDYIFKMSNVINQKHLKFLDSSLSYNQNNLNKEFSALIELFSTTRLTRKESIRFKLLKENFEALNHHENIPIHLKDKKQIVFYIDAIKKDLNNLSLIQMSESKYKLGVAQKSLDTNNFMSKMEIVFLILIGVIVQFALFYKVSMKRKRES